MIAIDSIIDKYFDWDFFWKRDSSKKQAGINEVVSRFKQVNEGIESIIISNAKTFFPQWKTENHTYFLEQDRCYTFEMTNKENELDTYVFYLSIFGFFAIKRQIKKIEDGRIVFIETNEYINKGSSAICDSIYDGCLQEKKSTFIWLDNKKLSQRINKLSLIVPEDDIDMPITAAKVLFGY